MAPVVAKQGKEVTEAFLSKVFPCDGARPGESPSVFQQNHVALDFEELFFASCLFVQHRGLEQWSVCFHVSLALEPLFVGWISAP